MIVLLEKHGADPNTIIPKLQIAPIHYAVGFDNLEFAEKVTAVFLKKNANPNLFSESDCMTPLHIACIWGRPKIVQMLLEHGGDLDLKCSEGQTPITLAIHENHYQVIDVIKKFAFEQKIERKKKELILKAQNRDPPSRKPPEEFVCTPLRNPPEEPPRTPLRNLPEESFSTPSRKPLEESFSTPAKNHHLKNAIQHIDDKKFTPNRINYNFDATSPYYVNITHRRHKTSRENRRAVETDENCDRKNLFELTERNLKQFSREMTQVVVVDRLAIHKRRSYIKDWREKIQQIRRTNEQLDFSYINFLNACNDVNSGDEAKAKSSSDSFETAVSELQRVDNAIGNSPEPPEYIEHVEEDYIHSDYESGVVLLERKIISKSRVDLNDLEERNDDDDARSESSVSTKVTLPSLDYDTDVLRKELKHLTGSAPGPITKNTKRLYLKQLVKLKARRPEMVQLKTNNTPAR